MVIGPIKRKMKRNTGTKPAIIAVEDGPAKEIKSNYLGTRRIILPGGYMYMEHAVFRLGGVVNTDRVAKGHNEGEGVGGGCSPFCVHVEREAPFYKVNWRLKRGPFQHYKINGYRFSAKELPEQPGKRLGSWV
jgi:hypothetical protein